MKRINILYFLLLIFFIYSCNSNDDFRQVKKKLVTIYSVKNIRGNFLKDTISSKYETGFDKDGKQKYIIGVS